MRVSTIGCVVVISFFLWGCSGGAGTGGAGGDDSAASSGANASKVCEGEEVSVSQPTEKEEDCASIAVVINLEANSELAKIAGTVGESIAASLDNTLTRASVVTNSDAKALETLTAWQQLLGGEDDGGVAVRKVAAAYNSADILVIPTLSGDPNGLMALTVVAVNRADDAVIARVGASGTGTDIGKSLGSLGGSLAEKIKKARVCLSLTPVRVVIDFDKEEKRKQEFTASVKDLKNEPLNEDKVSFTLDNTEGGTLSAESVAISNGEAKTTFTMTKRQPNALDVTYKGKFATQTDSATIIPLCGWLLVIEGEKTFTLDHASPAWYHMLFGDGAWITLKGTNTVGGHVALSTLEDEKTIFGSGWMVENQNLSGGAFFYIYSFDGEGRIIGDCQGSGTVTGTANGDWMVWGNRSSDTMTIQGMALGSSAGGSRGTGRCELAGLMSGGGGSSQTGVYSEFRDVTMPLKAGATADVSGTGAFFEEKYKYHLTLKRAAP